MADNRHLRLPPGALLVSEAQALGQVKLWCEYAIWGLLFYDDQSPWLTVVEGLHICFDRWRKGEAVLDPTVRVAGGPHEVIRYGGPLNYHLRHLLFRDRDILEIAGRQLDDSAMWQAWETLLERDQVTYDFDYLKDHFQSFRDVANAVELLRSAEIESHTAKRWTSRHLLPLGSAMLFPDVDRDGKLDRKFMRRTGELLYLMLNRAERRVEVAQLITERLLRPGSLWNDLAAKLVGPDPSEDVTTTVGYLPLPTHKTYDILADDWASLLSLEGVPIENVLDPLERLSGLAQALYIIQRAQETIGPDTPLPPFFLDLVGAPGANPVRKLSTDQHRRHKAMLLDATSRFVDDFTETEEWQTILDNDARKALAQDALRKRFRWSPPRPNDPDRLPTPEQQITELRTEAQAARGHSISSTFKSHVRHIGMLRAHRRSGTWYAPNDSFLEALVLSSVGAPMEFGEFLQLLHIRYNIVVGPEEVRRAFRVSAGGLPAPLADLQENERRLEERLRVLGFLDRKSDDCAFVMNPFHRPTSNLAGAPTLVTA